MNWADTFAVGATAAFIVAALSGPAEPQGAQTCAPRDHVVLRLEQKYGETARILGLTSDGSLLEVWASYQTGSWTVVVTTPSGVSCLLAAGLHYGVLPSASPDGDPL